MPCLFFYLGYLPKLNASLTVQSIQWMFKNYIEKSEWRIIEYSMVLRDIEVWRDLFWD